MFTGIVETIGSKLFLPRPTSSISLSLRKTASSHRNRHVYLRIANAPSVAVAEISLFDSSSPGSGRNFTVTLSNEDNSLSDASLGDSISINGTCLTVTSLLPREADGQEHDQKQAYKGFTVGVSPETLRRTNLGSLGRDSQVNLERACLPTTRLGGHFVQGHVDTIASILSVTPDGEALTFRLQPRDRKILKYVVEKGYVTLDGASLTITEVVDSKEEEGGWFEVMLIDYTQSKVVMGSKKAGAEVNLEVDMVGKYVEKSVVGWLEGKGGGGGIEGMIQKVVVERMNVR